MRWRSSHVIDFFDSIKLGGPPAVYVFDQSGQQVKRFVNDNSETEFTYEKDVVPLPSPMSFADAAAVPARQPPACAGRPERGV